MKAVVSFFLNAFMGLAFGMMFAFPGSLQAQYAYQNGTLYERYLVQESYTYCGRAYVRNVWKYRPVVSYKAKDWRETALNVINAEKERQAFASFVSNIGATNLMGGGAAYGHASASATLYPSATGNTFGGFSSLEVSRYGATSAFDVNKASEQAQLGLDTFTRVSADNALRADAITQQVGELQRLNVERVGAIAEIQETRAAMREMSAVTKELFAGQVEVLRALRPPASETFRLQQSIGGQSSADGQASAGGQPAPQAAAGVASGLVSQYCGKCHGKASANPSGGLVLDSGGLLSAAEFGGAALRLAPDSPEKLSSGKTFKMPPAGEPQPNVDERRQIVNDLRAMVRME